LQELFLVASKLAPLLLYPFSLALLSLMAALLPRRASRTRVVFVGVALGILLVGSCAPIGRELGRTLEWQYLPLAEIPEGDVIVLLGGATAPQVYPRTNVEVNEAADRLFEAARLFKAGRAPRILICGGRFDNSQVLGPDTDDVTSLLGELGVPADALLRESDSRNTFENAVGAKRLLAPLGLNRILLVTSAMHMPRAVGLFRHQGFDVVPVPVDFGVTEELPSDYGSWFEWASRLLPQVDFLAYTTRVLREYMGIAVYRLRGEMD
jgi:uncharacterized SAM-binding protein YcdF (DUF218 family)